MIQWEQEMMKLGQKNGASGATKDLPCSPIASNKKNTSK